MEILTATRYETTNFSAGCVCIQYQKHHTIPNHRRFLLLSGNWLNCECCFFALGVDLFNTSIKRNTSLLITNSEYLIKCFSITNGFSCFLMFWIFLSDRIKQTEKEIYYFFPFSSERVIYFPLKRFYGLFGTVNTSLSLKQFF